MTFKNRCADLTRLITALVTACHLSACSTPEHTALPVQISTTQLSHFDYVISGKLNKKLVIHLHNPKGYASLSVYANNTLLIDNLTIPSRGHHKLNSIVRFQALGKTTLKIQSNDADITIRYLALEELADIDLPLYEDISIQAGLDKIRSIKYGGPTIADIDNDGDYDFIVNNHNAETSKLYWNNGDGSVTKHNENLSRWFRHDLHGTAAGDYDNDGDLDLIVTQGGGNGAKPSRANFYLNENNKLIRFTGDVGIDRGARGRGVRWSDMDLDGDLDLFFVNEEGLKKEKPQHFFYENTGTGTFTFRSVEGIQDAHPSRALITDFNNDNIDDIILYGPLSVWQGNGDFTFTKINTQFPAALSQNHRIMAIADIDIDNDGDLDLYLAGVKNTTDNSDHAPSLDLRPLNKEMSIMPSGLKGIDKFEFTADAGIKFYKYSFMTRGGFNAKDYPIFLGRNKDVNTIAANEELDIDPTQAQGWPTVFSQNGIYFGHLGDGHWKAALVRNDDIFWRQKFTLSGVSNTTLNFMPENRNGKDILLRNDGDHFTDASKNWNLQPGGNSRGVTVGDFNNDGHQDLFVYRWGLIGGMISDHMLLNTGEGNFETLTLHGANDAGGPGNGDMGQAFDFDLDGDLDLLNGREGGEWYLYANTKPGTGNYALVRVGYAPKSNIDAISAEVILTTEKNTYRKRVGSAGEVFSQSLLNIIHFGLGNEDKIKSIKVRWRNGETLTMSNKLANTLFDTDKITPSAIAIKPSAIELRKGSAIKLDPLISSTNADKKLKWASSDTSIVSVNKHGTITALGEPQQTANIIASNPSNDISASAKITIVPWYPKPIQALTLNRHRVVGNKIDMVSGRTLTLAAKVQPDNADDSSLSWSSSNPQVVSVDAQGTVQAKKAGESTIKVTSHFNKNIRDSIQITVAPLIEPFIKIINGDHYENSEFAVNEDLTVRVRYHAGSANKVISSDEGGIRFWLRHFKKEWIPEKDIILVDESVLNTESGQSTMRFSLDGLTPSDELPEGHFYQLRVSFTSSDGRSHEDEILPIKLIRTKTAK